jgi:hypothetical protein
MKYSKALRKITQMKCNVSQDRDFISEIRIPTRIRQLYIKPIPKISSALFYCAKALEPRFLNLHPARKAAELPLLK